MHYKGGVQVKASPKFNQAWKEEDLYSWHRWTLGNPRIAPRIVCRVETKTKQMQMHSVLELDA